MPQFLRKTQKSSSKKGERGQIAIFMVFVFQVLFILLGMTINISMTVYDKINFQNSLDLAAYYGAKKQAEVLNAMAHINYQMRQNWKLLSWRYRILGTLTQTEGAPGGTQPRRVWCPQNSPPNMGEDRRGVFCPSDTKDNPFYFVCVSDDTWKRGVIKDGTAICKEVGKTLPELPDLNLQTNFNFIPFSWAGKANNAMKELKDSLAKSCPLESALNYLTAQLFLIHFRLDQKDRKTMMRQLYEKTLKVNKDLEGASIEEGAKKVFFHNLSGEDRASLRKGNKGMVKEQGIDQVLKNYNSFETKSFKDIFKHVNVFPVLNYLYIKKVGQSSCGEFLIYPHTHYPNNFDGFYSDLSSDNRSPWTHIIDSNAKTFLKQFFDLNNKIPPPENPQQPLQTMTLGFYKNLGTELYYGLYAEMKYNRQLFGLPESNVVFKASAFAKPFGGRFGLGHPLPNGDFPDKMIKIPTSFNTNNLWIFQPNYSRFPEDKLGLLDSDMHRNDKNSPYSNFLNKQKASNWKSETKNQVYTVDAFLHLVTDSRNKNTHDPLARPWKAGNPHETDPFSFMRMMELMAVWPDAFDITYYSIFGNYMATYFPKVCNLLVSPGDPSCNPTNPNPPAGDIDAGLHGDQEAYIRGDFGWPFTAHYMRETRQLDEKKELSIAPLFLKKSQSNEIDEWKIRPSRNPNDYKGRALVGDESALTQGKIFYPWLASDLPGDLLTSWVPTRNRERYEDYKERMGLFEDAGRITAPFMNCDTPVQSPLQPVPSSCVAGGRSGYSVKLISCEVVKELWNGNRNNRPLWFNKACP